MEAREIYVRWQAVAVCGRQWHPRVIRPRTGEINSTKRFGRKRHTGILQSKMMKISKI